MATVTAGAVTPRRKGAKRPPEYRLHVLATSVTDVVQSVGGWLFDRAKGGWHVTVGVGDDPSARALRILGIDAAPLELALGALSVHPIGRDLVVAADAWSAHDRVQALVRAAIRVGRPSVSFWGGGVKAADEPRFQTVRYHPSAAARAFKKQALAAVAADSDDDLTCETFRSVRGLGAIGPDVGSRLP